MGRETLSYFLRLIRGIVPVLLLATPVAAQFMGEDAGGSGLSKQMQLAIHLYQQGRDTEAMDRFMEVLINGDPSERTMANEYLNLITQRQNTAAGGFAPSQEASAPQPDVIATSVPSGTRHLMAAPIPPAEVAPSLEAAPEAAPEPTPGVIRREEEPSQNVSVPRPQAVESQDRQPDRLDQEMSRNSKAVMKKEIETAVRNKSRAFLGELEKFDDVRIIMADDHNPRAIGIPTGYLFDSGTIFKRNSAKLLKSVAGLVYCLGATQVDILPEGVTSGDPKILDMRRTMGISSYLIAAGIAPPRIRVNLLQSQVDLPRGLADFQGIILLFVYNQPLTLTAERLVGEESGPPISLGTFPDRINPERDEGTIIEFSVVEPPAGLSSWKFHLLQPSRRGSEDLAPLQEVLGGSPVFHQIYWNGRKNYFGDPFPPGSYEVVLTATDSKGRSKTLHKWIAVEGAAVQEYAPPPASETDASGASSSSDEGASSDDGPLLVSANRAGASAGGPPSDLAGSGAGKLSYTQLSGSSGAKAAVKKKAVKKKSAKKKSKHAKAPVKMASAPVVPPSAQTGTSSDAQPSAGGIQATPPPASGAPGAAAIPSPAQSPSPKSQSSTASYQIQFVQNTEQIMPAGDRALNQVADSMTYYPLVNLNLIGYASSSETDAQALAQRRASQVSSLLVNKYNVDSRRIQIQTKVVDDPNMREVDISFVQGKE